MLSGAFAFEDEIVHIELSSVLKSPDRTLSSLTVKLNSESVIIHYCFSAMVLGGENHPGITTANQ